MDAADGPPQVSGRALLAGLEAGMTGVLVMLGWLALASEWNQHSGWSTVKLLASSVYGEAALRPGFTRACVSGTAMYLVLYSLLGSLFVLCAEGGRRRISPVALGVLWGVVWYYLLFGIVWKHLNPLIALYTHDAPMLAGHLFYGSLLGSYPAYLLKLLPALPESENDTTLESGRERRESHDGAEE